MKTPPGFKTRVWASKYEADEKTKAERRRNYDDDAAAAADDAEKRSEACQALFCNDGSGDFKNAPCRSCGAGSQKPGHLEPGVDPVSCDMLQG